MGTGEIKYSTLMGVVNVTDPIYGGAIGGYWDTAVAAAYAATPSSGVLFFPAGTYPMASAFIITKSIKVLGSGMTTTFLTTANNITNIVIGTYNYTGVNDWNSSYLIRNSEVADISLINTGTSIANSEGLQLRGVAYGNFRNIGINGPTMGLTVRPICSWNHFDNLLIQGTYLSDGVKVFGDGYESGYNSTGNRYSNVTAIGFTRAAFEAYGAVFGDIMINNIFGYGNSGNAGIYLTSTGSKLYANKIAVNGIDMDGSMTYGLYADGIHQLRAEILNLATAFTTYYVTGGADNIIIDPTGVHTTF